MDELRAILYPLGFLSSLAFGARFFIQWMQSEIKQQSVVSRAFWYLSLAGNLSLAVHSLIQVQYHVCLIQSLNAVISWRNLSLMTPNKIQPSLKQVFFYLFATAAAVTAIFTLQDIYLFGSQWDWFRTPTHQWQQTQQQSLPFAWHVIGFASYALFSSRFWIQWLESEKHQKSELGLSFWWLSISGASLSVFYFISIHDIVNIIGPVIGLIPYTRNLMLIYKKRNAMKTTPS